MIGDNHISYFSGCMANYVDPEIGQSTVSVLKENGFNVFYPKQKCCGTPQLSAGKRKRFIENALYNINALSTLKGDIITACTSCSLTLKHDYPQILKTAAAESVARRTYDIIEYLSMLKTRGRLNENFNPVNLRAAYHIPCHLKVLGETFVDDRFQLLNAIPGISVVRLNSGCCGMGGTFGVKKNTFDYSMAIGNALFKNILSSDFDITITDCPTCKLQIQQGTSADPLHPVNIVRQAYN